MLRSKKLLGLVYTHTPQRYTWTQDCLLDHVLFGNQLPVCVGIVCPVGIQAIFWLPAGELVCPLRRRVWGLQGREELDRPLAQKQSVLLSSPLQTGWLFQQSTWLSLCDTWKILVNYEKDLRKKRLKIPEEVTQWQDKEMMLRDGPCQAQMRQTEKPSLSSLSLCSAVARQVLILIRYVLAAYSCSLV